VDQPSILIISDDAEFSRLITSRWQAERHVPGFIVMGSDLGVSFDPENFQLAVVGRIHANAVAPILEAMKAANKAVVFLAEESQTLQSVRERWPAALRLAEKDNWLDMLVLAGTEALHRQFAELRAQRAEQHSAMLERQATLGRYMLEMRHTLNNSLTSTLGNSELLLLEPGVLSAEARAQVETIHNMTLRIHEIMQRFSSLEKELNVLDRQKGKNAPVSFASASR
jgi:signal transduction histidine kinase